MIVDPTIITKKPNATTIAQKAVTILLPCQVSHDPTVNVTWEWRKNTGRLYDSRYTVLRDGTLQIVSTQEIDAATFSCNVYSNGGNASVSTVLQIVCKFAKLFCDFYPSHLCFASTSANEFFFIAFRCKLILNVSYLSIRNFVYSSSIFTVDSNCFRNTDKFPQINMVGTGV